MKTVKLEDILAANHALKDVITKTPLQKNEVLSKKYQCNVFLKREDLQIVRSFKIRGAYNLMCNLSMEQTENGIVCASAGNHAQGVAYSCHKLQIYGKIFMPTTTPNQKVSQVKRFGGSYVEVILVGDTFDDAYQAAYDLCKEKNMTFVHPFNDPKVIAGQGTVGMEIVNELEKHADFVFLSIGGGGLASGVGIYLKELSPTTKIIGVEPAGAPSMKESLSQGQIVTLAEIDKFVDGAAVKQVGEETFKICQKVVDDVVVVPEGKVCSTILDLYNDNAIVAEPAGAMPIAALDQYKDQIIGKNVVCVVSGGNNDIDRMQDIKERSLMYEGLKQYFIISFPQRAGALREFIEKVLGKNDDITHFEYTKKNNKDNGPALVGIELKYKQDYVDLINRMKTHSVQYIEVNHNEELFKFLV